MILSFFIALLGYTLLAAVAILDKLILSKSVKSSATYAFYSTVFFLVLFALVPFHHFLHGNYDYALATISGLSFGFGLWTMFNALKLGETSHISPFLGGIVALSTYGLSYLLLGESLTHSQQWGVLLLVAASLLFSLEKTEKRGGFHKGFLWAILSGVLFAIAHVSSKYIYDIYPFITGIIWTKATAGIVGLLALLMPSVRKAIKTKDKPAGTARLIVTDKILGIAGVILIQYAIAIGSVTIVNAMAGIQFALVFIFAYALTKTAPKFFTEYFTTRELIFQTTAIVLVMIGSALFAMNI
jgi:uncharacterized membrane protein